MPRGHRAVSEVKIGVPGSSQRSTKLRQSQVNVLPQIDKNKNNNENLSKFVFSDAQIRETFHSKVLSSKRTYILASGDNGCGQCGLGEREMSKKPRLIDDEHLSNLNFVQVVAGGMHSLLLTADGKVFSAGCNDSGVLGRESDDDDGNTFQQIEFNNRELGRVVLLSAGDSHSAALTDRGRVLVWGTFRSKDGATKFSQNLAVSSTPLLLDVADVRFVKISSGENHLLLLDDCGIVYSIGASECGQLGRPINERNTRFGPKIDDFYIPKPVQPLGLSKYRAVFCNVFATGNSSFLVHNEPPNKIWVCGLNNFMQLGIGKYSKFDESEKLPVVCNSLSSLGTKPTIIEGDHHMLMLFENGNVCGVGRCHDGRLARADNDAGLEPFLCAIDLPDGLRPVHVTAANSTNIIVAESGSIYGFGFNGSHELGLPDLFEEVVTQPQLIQSNHLEDKQVIRASLGGQHALFLAVAD